MRPVQIACQLRFYPLGVENYEQEISHVLELIAGSGLHVEIGPMSTVIRGEAGAVLGLIGQIIDLQAERHMGYSMNMTLSNICGCA